MSSSPKPSPWAQINELARMAKNGTPKEQNIAWEKLIPSIQCITRRAVRGLSPSSRFDPESFVEESPRIIFEKLTHYDPERNFVPWAAKVLRNAALDQIGKASQERPESDFRPRPGEQLEDSGEVRAYNVLDYLNVKTLPSETEKVQRALDADTPFCQGDLACLESELTAQARVTVLIVLGAANRVPAATWTQWLADAGFPADFQPPTFAPEDDLKQRIKIVAECLGEAFLTIRARWRRALPTLRKMKFLIERRENI